MGPSWHHVQDSRFFDVKWAPAAAIDHDNLLTGQAGSRALDFILRPKDTKQYIYSRCLGLRTVAG